MIQMGHGGMTLGAIYDPWFLPLWHCLHSLLLSCHELSFFAPLCICTRIFLHGAQLNFTSFKSGAVSQRQESSLIQLLVFFHV